MSRHDHHVPGAIEEVLEEAHLAIALIAGTLVASPVIVAALSGRREVPAALGMYLAAIVGCWVVVGLLGGAMSMTGRRHALEPRAEATVTAPVTDPDPVTSSR